MVAGSVNSKSGSRATTRRKEVGRLHECGYLGREEIQRTPFRAQILMEILIYSQNSYLNSSVKSYLNKSTNTRMCKKNQPIHEK